MLTIPRSLAGLLRTVFRRSVDQSRHRPPPPVVFQPKRGGLSIRFRGRDAAIAYQFAESDAPCHVQDAASAALAVPLELLDTCAGQRDEPVTLRRVGKEVLAQWTDAGFPQTARRALPDLAQAGSFPPSPRVLRPHGPELLRAWRDAVATAGAPSARGFHCVQLRGGLGGRIAATDGNQLLIQEVGAFPWRGDVLVPAGPVIADIGPIAGETLVVGRTDDWVTLRSGPWTVHQRIETGSRFPEVEQYLPQIGRAQSTLHLSEADARFFLQAVARLPGGSGWRTLITVDLHGSVVIRAPTPDGAQPTELILTGSRGDGAAIQFNTNRAYLARAIRLGFRRVDLFGPEAPACCRDRRRTYVWALLTPNGAVTAAPPGAVRIESPGPSDSFHPCA